MEMDLLVECKQIYGMIKYFEEDRDLEIVQIHFAIRRRVTKKDLLPLFKDCFKNDILA